MSEPTLPNPMVKGERARPTLWLLTESDVETLARYNAEQARGIMHTDEWRAEMARYQATFDQQRGTPPLPSDGKKRRWR